jgi:hypothetical protein
MLRWEATMTVAVRSSTPSLAKIANMLPPTEDLSWPALLDGLIEAGDQLHLWDRAVREQLARRFAAAETRSGRAVLQKSRR